MQVKEPTILRRVLIAFTLISLTFIIILPIIFIFSQALSKGFLTYWNAISDPYILSALKLTLFITFICLLLNLAFGLSIGWCLGKFRIFGSRVIIGLIELPLAISPVTAGLTFIVFFGRHSLLGSWLHQHGIDIIFAVPGVVIATLFVTFPYIAREVIPLMQETGNEEEEAALLLGSGGLHTFFHITLPNIKWGVIYGLLITNARAMGEFGAVSVVSGGLIGKTTTLTLQIESLYNDYDFAQSFAVSSLLAFLAIATLLIKTWIERKKG